MKLGLAERLCSLLLHLIGWMELGKDMELCNAVINS